MMPSSLNQNRIQLWFPDLFESKGGIQVYSAFMLKALQSIYPDGNYDVFLKHDRKGSREQEAGSRGEESRGAREMGSRGEFISKQSCTFPPCPSAHLPPCSLCPAPSHLSFQPNTKFHFSGAWPLSLRTPAFAANLIGSGLWQRPNLVITTHLNFTVVAYWLKRLVGIPYWTVAHGVEAWNIQRPALQTALRHADRILAVSSYTRDRLLKEQNLDPSKISILPNTFDPHRFGIATKPAYLLERYGLEPQQPIILTVNRLCRSESYKGYDKILEALPQIRQAIPNVHYIIVGKGDDRPRLEQLIHQHQLQECVTLAGFIPDPQLCNYYNLCDVFAMPSRLEGFGIVYLEALACGKPTLGGNQDGAINALCHGELGALVAPDDVGAIAKTIIQILQGTYPHPIMYQPEILRQKVIDIYGFDHFKHTLFKYLEEFFAAQDSNKAKP